MMEKEKIIKSIKMALAALAAIAIAGELGLEYSATAGIITVLSIQNTKRETFVSARNRGLAFICALFLAAFSFRVLGYSLPAFAFYLFAFSLLCFTLGWGEAIAMDSVLVSHFLLEGSMSFPMILNEIGLFLIGTGLGIIVNLHLRKKGEEFSHLAEAVDEQIKGILYDMSFWLLEEDKSQYDLKCFQSLKESLDKARLCAVVNYNNELFHRNTHELDYIQMREQQSIILQEVYENIRGITYLPKQAEKVSELLVHIEQEYHRENTVEALINEMKQLFQEMKKEELPGIREEFEARAILFYILKQLEEFLFIKSKYMKSSD